VKEHHIMSNNQITSVDGQTLPYLFILPGDLGLVKTFAYMQALENAHIVIQENREFLPVTVGYMAGASCALTEQVTYDGKRGTNDPILFQRTYVDTFLAYYPIAREHLLTGWLVIDPAWTEQERLGILFAYAAKRLAEHN
jgi:hypothetical protein